MKSEIWQDKQKVLVQDLSYAQSTKEGAVLERATDVFEKGVVRDSQLAAESVALALAPGDTSNTITIGTGVAYSPLGERILVPNPVTVYNPTAPTTQSPDGLGGFKTTPQSTGTKNVPVLPLLPSTTYHVWIGYLQTIDPLIFTLKKGSVERLYTQAGDGFEVAVNTSGSNPDSTRYIKVGTAVTNSLSQILTAGISLASREDLKTKSERVGITVPLVPATDRPSTYALGETKFLDDHINAVGTGLVTPLNPHGITPADLGLSEIGSTNHQGKFHSSGVFTSNQNSTVSALYMDVVVQSVTNDDLVIIRALTSEEGALVSGIQIDSSNIGADATFTFLDSLLAPIATGYYLFRLDNVTKQVERVGPYLSETDPLFLSALTEAGKFPLWSIDWELVPVFANPLNHDLLLTTKKDWRVFGTTSSLNMQSYTVAGLNSGTAIGNRTQSFYHARIVGSVSSQSFNADFLTLTVSPNGGSPQTATFSGIDPISIFTLANQINTQLTGVIALVTSTFELKLLASDSLLMGSGTANATFGFTSGTFNSGTLKEVRVAGDFSGSTEFSYDGVGRISITNARYGNKLLRQTTTYTDATPASTIASIVEEVLNP